MKTNTVAHDIAEKPAPLPEGWVTSHVEELFDSWGGVTPSTDVPAYWDGDFPWISSKDIKNNRLSETPELITERALRETRLRVCQPGSVLVVVRSGVLAHSLPVAIANRPVVINQDLKAFDSGHQALNRWLALFLQATQQAVLRTSRREGTTVQSVKIPELVKRQIPLPPLDEQSRIAEKVTTLLTRVGAARERLRKGLSTVKRFRQSLLTAACAGQLTEGWSSRHVPANDRDWVQKRLGDVFDVSTGATPLRKNTDYFKNGNVPWVKSGAVNRSTVTEADEFITQLALNETNAKIFPPGTLLVAMYGEGATRGKVAELGIAAATNQALAAILFSEDTASIRPFLKLILRNRYNQSREDSAGGVQPNLSLQMIRDIEFALPSGLEQQEIVRRVDGLTALSNAVEARIGTTLVRVERLTQAILAKAFAGELVPTEAELARREGRDYEPASVLIERIRRERPAATKAVRTSRSRPRRG